MAGPSRAEPGDFRNLRNFRKCYANRPRPDVPRRGVSAVNRVSAAAMAFADARASTASVSNLLAMAFSIGMLLLDPTAL
jgi:hypothetical protein